MYDTISILKITLSHLLEVCWYLTYLYLRVIFTQFHTRRMTNHLGQILMTKKKKKLQLLVIKAKTRALQIFAVSFSFFMLQPMLNLSSPMNSESNGHAEKVKKKRLALYYATQMYKHKTNLEKLISISRLDASTFISAMFFTKHQIGHTLTQKKLITCCICKSI